MYCYVRFVKDRSGAFLPIFALVTAVLLVSVGMGLDYARALNDRGKGQAVADSMVLAMAHELRLGASEEVAREAGQRVYDAYYGGGSEAASLAIEELDNLRGFDLKVAFPGSTETTLMKLARFDEMPWQVRATSRVGMGNLELALVVDVSHSMLDKEKMKEMREALKRLVGAVFPIDQPATGRTVNLIPYADSVHLGPDYYDWFDDEYLQWFRQLGYFDDPNCLSPESIEDRIENTPVNIGNIRLFMPTTMNVGGNEFSYCPPDGSKIVLFENDRDTLINAIEKLENGWGTGTDIGLSWGWRSLSPSWREAFAGKSRLSGYPRNFNSSSLKIITILTDGHTIRYDPAGDGGTTRGKINGVWEPDKLAERFAWATDHLKQTCDAISREGKIKLYTIGYDLDSPADVPRQEAMKALTECPANGGKHYDADYGELANVIDQLIAEFNIVRLYE